MSLHPQPIAPVPEQTARVARAAFPKGNPFLLLRDELGTLFTDADFADLYPTHGQPAEAPWRLALVTLWQFMEHLSDRKAAKAVRGRIDWKYALGLELEDPGFDSTILCEFRSRLIEGSAEQRLLEAFLNGGRERGWLKARGRQRTDSTHVLGRIRALNRLGCVIETFRATLNAIAIVDPKWLCDHADPEWIDRYGRSDESRLPTGQKERQTLAEQVGIDGDTLLSALFADPTAVWAKTLPALQTLVEVWRQQFLMDAGTVHWRTEQEGIPPASLLINSPYDTEARYAKKRSTSWVGY